MSKRSAALGTALVRALTAPLARWSRIAALARTSTALVPVVSVNTRRGTVSFHTPSKTAMYWPRYAFEAEPETLAWIDGFGEGSVLWDIGASVGAYSMYAALLPGVRVLAFEANPHTFDCLVRNVQHNRLDETISTFCVALSDEPGVGRFHMPHAEAGSVGNVYGDASLSRTGDLSGGVAMTALSVSIDFLLRHFDMPAPTHVKIDVDSIEDRILFGGREALKAPTVRSALIEMEEADPNQRKQCRRILELMTEFGFQPTQRHDFGYDRYNQLFERPHRATG